MTRKASLSASAGATLFLTLAALVALIAQPRATECGSTIPGQESGSERTSAQAGGCAVAFPCFFHSLTSPGLPIDSASQHVSTGFAVDEHGLRLFPISADQMALNFFDTVRGSTIALAASALVSACGGGGSGGDEPTQA